MSLPTKDLRGQPGALTLDRWVGRRYGYSIFDHNAGDVTGGYSVVNEGEATPEQYAELRKAGRAVPDEKVAA